MNNSLDDFNINFQRKFLNVGKEYFPPLVIPTLYPIQVGEEVLNMVAPLQ